MRYALTNYGHRYIHVLAQERGVEAVARDPLPRPLLYLLGHTSVPADQHPGVFDAWVAQGMVQLVGPELDDEALRLRYERNPLEHLSRLVLEITKLCNLDCSHCRNGNLEAEHEAHPERLRPVIDAMIPIGVRRVDFIGGEVTLFGKGWLDLARYARARGANHVSVITSGWFLGEQSFLAAGRTYRDDGEYLTALRESGVTHVVFSLDGPESVHDRWRNVPGLYRRVISGIGKVRDAGLVPRLSLVANPGLDDDEQLDWMSGLAHQLYELSPESDRHLAVSRLMADDSNYVSNLIDVGGAVQLRRGRRAPHISDEALRCKNFFRPAPTFRVRANGEVSLCPLIEGGDGYGNVHDRGVIEILNGMQDALVYRLHAERRIGTYREHLDPELFGHVSHVCTLRVALNMLAREMARRNVDASDAGAMREINREVAEKMGLLPRAVKHRANGHRRPAAH